MIKLTRLSATENYTHIIPSEKLYFETVPMGGLRVQSINYVGAFVPLHGYLFLEWVAV